MNRLFSAKTLAAAAVALGAVGAASVAHARSDVVFSIGFNTPVYTHGAPLYSAPQPVYVQPAPVYVQPRPVYVQPRPVYVQPEPVYYGHHYGQRRGHGDWDRDGIPNRYDRHPHRHDGRIGNDHGWGDYDGDGVPNRYDARPHNPYRY